MRFETLIVSTLVTGVTSFTAMPSLGSSLNRYGMHSGALVNEREHYHRRYNRVGVDRDETSNADLDTDTDVEIEISDDLEMFQNGNVEEISEDIFQDALDTKVGLQYDTVVYNYVLNEFAKAGSSDALKKAKLLLDRMMEEGRANTVSFNSYLNCLAKIGNQSAAAAEELLEKMESSDEIKPDVITYTSVIDAITRSSDKNRAERAEAIIDKMISLSSEGQGDESVLPNTVTYNAVLFAWSSSGRNDAASRAENLLKRMETMYESGQSTAQPNVISYTSVIDAHARSRRKENAISAEKVFERMEQKYVEGNETAQPNTTSFNALINSWVQSGKPGSALRAEAILVKMIKLSRQGNENVRPNVISFSTVVNGWSKCASREPGAAARAEQVFKTMLKEYKQGNESAKPNAISYCSLIDAYVKSKDGGALDRAEEIYESICKAYLQGNTDIKPSPGVLGNQIMDARSKLGYGEKTEQFLNNLDDLYKKSGDPDMQPDTRSYTIAINAWAKSRDFHKAKKAKEILDRMVTSYEGGNLNAKPNVFAYTAVLNACAFTLGDAAVKKEALQVAAVTYKELCSSTYDKPNQVTYAMYLRVCINLIPEGSDARQSTSASIFKKCRDDGQVTELILQLLERAFTLKQVEEITGIDQNPEGKIIFDMLPEAWRYKEVEHNERQRRRRTFSK